MIFVQILSIHSTPILSDADHQLMEDNTNDYHHHQQHHPHQQFLSLIKSIFHESTPEEQVDLLNQLREYLNRMCILGHLGSTNANDCQQVLDILHQNYLNTHPNDEFSDTSNETHGIQKRFFCNGFIGCKSSSG